MNEVRITRNAAGAWEAWDGDKTTGPLCMGELIEMVLKLTAPEIPGPRYALKTLQEWDK